MPIWTLQRPAFSIFVSGWDKHMRNLWVSLDLQVLFEEQVAFTHLRVVYQLHPFLNQETLLTVTCPYNLLFRVLHMLYSELPHLETSTGTECSSRVVYGARYTAHVISLLHELHGLLVCFQMQLNTFYSFKTFLLF